MIERRTGRERRERQDKTPCPACDHADSDVQQGWADVDGYVRRRLCRRCKSTFHTVEVLRTPSHVKKNLPATTSGSEMA